MGIGLLLIMLLQMIAASPQQSAAFDEGYTLTYGYAYLRTGEARLSRGQNPPLTNVLLALPLLLRNDIVFPIEHSTWAAGDIYGFSDEFLWKANPDPQRIVLLVRLPEMALALLLACCVYAFARSQFGDTPALAALALCAFDPNVLAHGHIAGTDLGLTLFMFGSVWWLTLAIKHNSRRRVIIAGVLAGAALATKYSAVWLGPMALMLGFVYPMPVVGKRASLAARFKLLLIFGLAAFVVIWATFGLSIGPITTGGPIVPAPDYWASLGRVGNRVESGTPAFMLGQISPTGFPLYYPFVFVMKTPLPTLLFLLIGLGALFARRDRRSIAHWVPPLLFLVAAMLSHLNLGYRLILPVLPFALTLAGRGVERVWTTAPRRRVARAMVTAAMLWLAFDTLSIAPEHIAYFNELAGSRTHNDELLVDSNLDWGQDLIALREWMVAQRLDIINLAYFGTARPSAYHVPANLLPSFTLNDFGPEVDGFSAWALKPGWYAISATSLRLGLLYTHWDLYAPFRARQPDARIGRSIWVYHSTYPSTEVDRTVVLGPIAGDLDQATLGGDPDRQLIVKWAGSDAAVLNMNGPARYVVRGGEPIVGFAPDVHTALVAQALGLGSDASGELRLFEIDARPALETKLKSLALGVVQSPDLRPIDLPVEFEGGLTLMGYDLAARPDGSIDLVTYWQARPPVQAGLSVFAHVLDDADQIVGQGDGLDVRLSSLESGDVILQHFTISLDKAATPSELHIDLGLYDPSSGERSPIPLQTGRSIDRLRIRLGP